jgi:outer membrane protein OmpA-like peptidoglycan-associated protein
VLRLISLYIIFLLIIHLGLFSKKAFSNNLSWGANYIILFEDAQFERVPGIPNCCEEFTKGKGTGYDIFASYRRNIFPSLFAGIKISIMPTSTEFTTIENTYIKYKGETVAGKFEHYLNMDFLLIFFEPDLTLNIWKNLHIGIGLPLGVFLSKDYNQKESIIEPSDAGTFLDSNGNDSGIRIRNKFSGEVQLKNRLVTLLNLSLSYELPLNSEGTLYLRPEVSFKYGISNLLSELNWERNYLSFGLSLHYQFKDDKSIFIDTMDVRKKPVIISSTGESQFNDETNIIDTSNVELSGRSILADQKEEFVFVYDTVDIIKKKIVKEIVTKSDTIIEFYGGTKNAEIHNLPIINITKQNFGLSIPLLNYIFFEKDSTEIPKRYLGGNRTYSNYIEQVYYGILDITGKRLQKYPNAELVLLIKKFDLDNDVGKAKSRAINIKEHITKKYNLAPQRVKIIEHQTDINEDYKHKNYDVLELRSDDPNILKPVIMYDTIFEFKPSLIEFHSGNEDYQNLDSWAFTLKINERLYREMKGKDNLPSTIKWDLKNSKIDSLDIVSSVNYQWLSNNINGKQNKDEGSFAFKLDEKLDSNHLIKKINKYIFYIRFDYNSYNLNEIARNTITELKRILKPDSHVIINGYSDNIGSSEYNLKLSESRAEAVNEALGIKNAEIKGLGHRISPCSNELPECQYYSRVAEIIVEQSK